MTKCPFSVCAAKALPQLGIEPRASRWMMYQQARESIVLFYWPGAGVILYCSLHSFQIPPLLFFLAQVSATNFRINLFDEGRCMTTLGLLAIILPRKIKPPDSPPVYVLYLNSFEHHSAPHIDICFLPACNCICDCNKFKCFIDLMIWK